MSQGNAEKILVLPTNDDISNGAPPTLTPPKPQKSRTIIEPTVFLIYMALNLSSKFSWLELKKKVIHSAHTQLYNS